MKGFLLTCPDLQRCYCPRAQVFFFNLGSWGRWETEIKPALRKLSNSKFTNSGFSLQFSRHSIIHPTAAEVWFLRARWSRLFTSIVPSNPLFKLHFPQKGGGVSDIRPVPGGPSDGPKQRAGERSPRSQVTPASRGNPPREGAGALRWPHYTALRCGGQLGLTWPDAAFP